MNKFKLVIYGGLAIAFIVVFFRLRAAKNELAEHGASFSDNTTKIEIDDKNYQLAMNYWAEMDYTLALDSLSKALEESNNKNGVESLESALISQKKGALLLEIGKYDEAYEYLNNAYVTFNKKLGEKDGNTTIARGQIGVYDIRTGNIERGLATLDSLYETETYFWRKVELIQMEAQCYVELGNYQVASDLYEALGNMYDGMGVYNLARVNMINDYACFMMTVGNYPQAIRSFQTAISNWKYLEIDEDSTLANIYTNLAQAYGFNGQADMAEETIKKALDIQKRLFGENNIQVAMSYDLTAKIYDTLGKTEDEKAYYDKALNTAINAVGENHYATAVIYYDLGEYFKYNGDTQKAIENYEKSLEIRKNILGLKSSNTIAGYEALAYVFRTIGELEKARENIDKAIEISEELYGRENVYTAKCYETATWIYVDLGELDIAAKYADLALGISDRQKNNTILDRPYAYQSFGYVKLAKKEYDEAEKYMLKALELYEASSLDNTENIASTKVFLSIIYLNKKDYENSFSMLTDTERIIQGKRVNKIIQEYIDEGYQDLYSVSGENIDFEEWLSNKKAGISKNE